jgi:hypothetical protein
LLFVYNSTTGGAIQGQAASGNDGVYGTSAGGNGVHGVDATGAGVLGTSTSGVGVSGISSSGAAVVAASTSSYDIFANGTGRLRETVQGFAGPPSGGGTTYQKGEMLRDTNGELCLCTTGGAPGTWVKVAHLSPGANTGGAITFLSKSIRLLDTRIGASDVLNNGGGPYAGGSTHTLTVAGQTFNGVTVPSNCIGAMGNLTAVSTSAGGGYLAVAPHGTGFSGTAILAYGPSQIVGNFFSVVLSGGQLDIIVVGNSTDVVFDLFAVVS